MRQINIFYLSLIVLALGLVWILFPGQEDELAFFGFADNRETEINYNYPVMVEEIRVTPGEKIVKGQPLILLTRKKAEEKMEKEDFEIATIEEELNAWHEKQASKKLELRMDFENERSEMDAEINRLMRKMERNKKLKQQLFPEDTSGIPELDQALKALETELKRLTGQYAIEQEALDRETEAGAKPFRTRIRELEAEKNYNESHKTQTILVEAPASGLIGNINCREGEHIPSFRTLMTLYEPHSTLIRGYVHEERILDIRENAVFEVSSLLREEVTYPGKLIGMGSRIVEIPTRLRKYPLIKTYGREVTIEIPEDNIFIQKEKVSVKLITE
jgi:multidrug resistance efflux pump